MMWIETTTGAVNTAFVIKIERDTDGSVLHLRDGSTVRSPLVFDVIGGQLKVVEPDDDDDSCPF